MNTPSQHHPVVGFEVIHCHPAKYRAEHEQRTVGKVDDVEQSEDHSKPQAQDRVERSIDQSQ
jgi:hypothetical protein